MINGWEISPLVKVCKIGDGNHSANYPKSNEMVSEGIPFIRANNMVNGKVSWVDLKFITPEKHAILKKGHLKEGDILFTNRGEIGKIAIVDSDFENANLNSQIAWFRCLECLNNKFLYYFLLSPSMQNHYLVEKNGAALQQFTIRQINEIPIPIPPLPEQQRIVAILDEAFAAIAKAKANAEQNLRNAKELFERYLAGVFEGKGEEWEEKKLGDIVDNIMTGPFGSMLHKSDYVEVGIPVVNPQNLVDGQIIPLRKTMINNDTFNRLEKYALKDGDIVIARRGEMGRCAIVKNINIGWLCGTGSFVIRVNKKKADSEFLNIFLSSAVVKKELEKLSIGATMSNLNQTILSELLIKAPPVIEQQAIVQKLDALSAETKKLEAIYQQKINDLEEMKKSILQKAFSGELTK